MSPAKKRDSSSSLSAWLRSLFAWLLGAGRPVLILAVLVGVFGGGTYLAWRKLKTQILSAPEYRVGPEQVEITPPPGWIHSDIRAEVFRDPTLDGPLSLMDDGLAERIANAFSLHPWVARVSRVTRQHPALVRVELVYRRPVCMVEVPGGVLAVDAEGVLLPREDFSPVEATGYPRLAGVERLPVIPAGRRWGDAKVVGGAEIAAAMGPLWETMKLQRIVPLAADPAAGAVGNVGGDSGGPTVGGDSGGPAVGGDSSRRLMEPVFALFTRGGTRILWGYAPGANVLGEIPAAEKVARLKRYLAENDTLDGPQGQRQELDVRTLGKSATGTR